MLGLRLALACKVHGGEQTHVRATYGETHTKHKPAIWAHTAAKFTSPMLSSGYFSSPMGCSKSAGSPSCTSQAQHQLPPRFLQANLSIFWMLPFLKFRCVCLPDCTGFQKRLLEGWWAGRQADLIQTGRGGSAGEECGERARCGSRGFWKGAHGKWWHFSNPILTLPSRINFLY